MPFQADILIIGGGLSGTLLAWQLLRLPGARRIVIVERRDELGRGEAYSATQLGHTLNANAARMSIDPDNPDDLTHWLTAHLTAGGWPEAARQAVPVAQLFPPRGLFGTYVQQRLAEAREVGAAQAARLERVQGEVVSLRAVDEGVCATLADGQSLQARLGVLATGLFPAARTPRRVTDHYDRQAMDPWNVAAMRQLPVDARVLIVGAGLTMLDALESLREAGHRGPVRVFSRHGLLPHPRRQPPAWPDFLAADPGLRSPRQLLHALRAECRRALAAGIDWQAPLDTVRVHIARLWGQASDRQRRQFVRHLRPWWESHHHRSPPQGDALLDHLMTAGRLSIEAAACLGLCPAQNPGAPLRLRIRRRGTQAVDVVEGDALIDSSGIEYDWRKVDRPLPRQLLADGWVQPGPLALGIAAAADGAVLNAQGQPAERLFSLGPPLRGMYWESTAVTDVAAQAKMLARRLIELR
jgi:uncharacterized NAD(P)/FAD-binding protein YdhS